MVLNGFDTDGDGENNFYTVNGLTFYFAKYPIRVRRSQTVRIYLANLTEFDLINSLPPARRLLPLLPDRLGRPVRVHRHGHALPGPARDHRDRLRQHGARSCSTRTSPSSPSSAGWASSRSSTDDDRVGPRRGGRGPAVAARSDPDRPARRDRLGLPRRPAARWSACSAATRRQPDVFDVRRVEFEPGEIRIKVTNPQTRRPDDRVGHGRRRDRPVLARRAEDARSPALVDRSSSPTNGSRTIRSRSG